MAVKRVGYSQKLMQFCFSNGAFVPRLSIYPLGCVIFDENNLRSTTRQRLTIFLDPAIPHKRTGWLPYRVYWSRFDIIYYHLSWKRILHDFRPIFWQIHSFTAQRVCWDTHLISGTTTHSHLASFPTPTAQHIFHPISAFPVCAILIMPNPTFEPSYALPA